MLGNGVMVEVYEDPFTRTKKEGNAKIVQMVEVLEPGVERYVVHFEGDAAGLNVIRVIVDQPSTKGELPWLKATLALMHNTAKFDRCCCYQYVGDNPLCAIHPYGGVQ